VSRSPIDPGLLRVAPALRRLIGALGALSIVGAGLVVTQAWALAAAIDEIFRSHDGVSAIVPMLVVLGTAMAGRAAIAGAQEWLTARASVAVRGQVRGAVLQGVLRLGPMWAQRQPPGRVVAATGPGLDSLDGYVTRAVPAFVAAAIVPAVALVAIILADWQCGVILLVLLPLVPLFMVLIGVTTKRYVARRYVILERLSGRFLDLLRGLTTLRVYGQADAQQQRLERSTDDFRRQTLSTLRVAFLSGLVLDLLGALSVAVVAVDIGLRLDAGHVGFRTALVVLILAPEVYAPLRAVGAQHHAAQEGTAAAQAALDILGEADASASPAIPSSANARDEALNDARNDCERSVAALRAATLRYPGRNSAALRGVDLDFGLGITALVGESGSGKSSVLSLLLGFVTANEGTVDRPPLEAVAWLPQRPSPSQMTVGDEVRLGDPRASDTAVASACRRCWAPEASTPLGEDGRSISAGQRRRVALARAMLRAESIRTRGAIPVVLLDEPSEDLDAATEQVVASVLDDLRRWCIVVVATHSQTLVDLADRTVTLAAGEVRSVVDAEPHPSEPLTTHSPQDVIGPAPRDVAPRRAQTPPLHPETAAIRLRDLVQTRALRRLLGGGIALAVLAALFGLGLAATSMWLISRAAQHPNVQALAVAVVGVRTFAVGRAVLRYGERVVTHDAALRMLTALRVRVFAALRPLPVDVLGDYGRGDLLRRFVQDVDGVQDGLVRTVFPVVAAVAGALGAVVIAFVCLPVAGIVLAVGIALAVAVGFGAQRLAGDATHLTSLAGARDRATTAFVDALGELSAYGQGEATVQRIETADAQIGRAERRPSATASVGVMLTGVLTGATVVGILIAAAQAANSGVLPVVEVGVLAVCALFAFDAVSILPSALVGWRRCRAGLSRVAEVLSASASLPAPAEPAVRAPDRVGLMSQHVCVAPSSGSETVVRDFNLELGVGERVALTGVSGCGKTTLLTAALRLLPVHSGRLALGQPDDCVDLAALAPEQVPPLVAGSLQGDHVFDADVRDNLRVVRPDAGDDDLDDVARRAGFASVISTLSDGWRTRVGVDGAALSGGQRQRLLLARALLADPAVLVLDEPTAHLDAETERAVLEDLLDATTGRTLLLTTHRRLGEGAVDRVVSLS
jgi:ATP-binding cassette subfamily C protein CydCD